MVKIKDSKGDTTEAVSLIMTKENAKAIIRGAKTIEFRKDSQFYFKMFCTSETKAGVAANKKVNFELKDVHYVHFHDYNNSWFLDVAIEAVDFMALLPINRPYFHERNCHEVDEFIDEAEQNGYDTKSDETIWVFCLPVKAIINTSFDLTDFDTVIQIKNISDAKYVTE